MSESFGTVAAMPAEKREVAISVKDLTKTYNIYARPVDRMLRRFSLWPTNPLQVHAVRNIAFDVNRGETLGIIGRNGSGKSTLLEMIVGTLTPDLGSIEVNGRISALLELGAGFDPDFTGRENLYLNALLMGFSRAEIEQREAAILEFSELGSFIDQPVRTYSSGMFVRLAFAIAINVDPSVMIIDEALAVGDAGFQRKCFAQIEKLKKAGATILFVSHSDRMIVELCDRALLLHHGHQLMLGTPKDVISAYNRILFDPEWTALADDPAAFRARLTQPEGPVVDVAPLSETENSESHFDPTAGSRSKFEFESQGARLRNPMVLNAAGDQVNMLRFGSRYTYTYEVEFDEDARGVRCGMLIKTVTGLELSSCGTTSRREAIDFVAAGSTLRVSFDFDCTLLPDHYFLNCGVSAIRGGSRQFLHRIVDALMIKVMPDPNLLAGHVVDLGYSPKVSVAGPDGQSRLLVEGGALSP